jgi:hypothetical protein
LSVWPDIILYVHVLHTHIFTGSANPQFGTDSDQSGSWGVTASSGQGQTDWGTTTTSTNAGTAAQADWGTAGTTTGGDNLDWGTLGTGGGALDWGSLGTGGSSPSSGRRNDSHSPARSSHSPARSLHSPARPSHSPVPVVSDHLDIRAPSSRAQEEADLQKALTLSRGDPGDSEA